MKPIHFRPSDDFASALTAYMTAKGLENKTDAIHGLFRWLKDSRDTAQADLEAYKSVNAKELQEHCSLIHADVPRGTCQTCIENLYATLPCYKMVREQARRKTESFIMKGGTVLQH